MQGDRDAFTLPWRRFTVRTYRASDVSGMREIWNEVVRAGDAFPQEEPLSFADAEAFFAEQTYCGVAVAPRATRVGSVSSVASDGENGNSLLLVADEAGQGSYAPTFDGLAASASAATAPDDSDEVVFGLYILHPNNVGRCGHVANASFAVSSDARGLGIGRALVTDALSMLAPCGFRGLQFNAVVDRNIVARRLYESLGFSHVGVIPAGFRMPDGVYEDIHIYYHEA